jgi:hypothetical protein
MLVRSASERVRGREQVLSPGPAPPATPREPLRQPRGERACRRDADPLAEDRAHRDLETVPAAGQPQSRFARNSGPGARSRNASLIACGSASRSNMRRRRLTIVNNRDDATPCSSSFSACSPPGQALTRNQPGVAPAVPTGAAITRA